MFVIEHVYGSPLFSVGKCSECSCVSKFYRCEVAVCSKCREKGTSKAVLQDSRLFHNYSECRNCEDIFIRKYTGCHLSTRRCFPSHVQSRIRGTSGYSFVLEWLANSPDMNPISGEGLNSNYTKTMRSLQRECWNCWKESRESGYPNSD